MKTTAEKSEPFGPSKCGYRNGRWRTFSVAVLALVLVAGLAAPAWAHARVFIGGWFGVPINPPAYGYPYAAYSYPYPAYSYPYPAYPAYGCGAVPPQGWVRGHWAWQNYGGGHRGRVWVPPHLR